MNSTRIRRLIYHVKHNYLTMNNIVMVVALFVAASWAWGSVQAMERNYALQKEVDYKRRELTLADLETDKLRFEQNYYKSDEYKELAVRERLGLAEPGEKVLILPPNSAQASKSDETSTPIPVRVEQSNAQAWVNFLFGGSARRS